MPSRLLAFLCLWLAAAPAYSATVLVLQFHNGSAHSDLDWVGESVAETLMSEFGNANVIVMDRAAREEALQRLSLRAGADYTKATLIRLGQTLNVDYVCFGDFSIDLPPNTSQIKDGSIRISARFIDLRKMHDGPELSETGKLTELSRLEEHLAYESLLYLEPHATLKLDNFMSPQKTVRLDAEESYVRGLLSTNKEQKQKWFLQAATLDNRFAGPVFELGKLALEQKQYAKAQDWLRRVPSADANYTEARFKMGLAAYGGSEYAKAADSFREVAKTFPLSEVYNDLGAAENELGQPAAVADFRRALDSDPRNPVYLFNLGIALLKAGLYEQAVAPLQQVADKEPDDAEARSAVEHARRREPFPAGSKMPAERLKTSFNDTAFRQLKAMLQPAK